MFVLGARKSRRLVGMEMSQISTPPSSCPAFANLWASSVCRSWSSASEVVFSAPVADVVSVSRGRLPKPRLVQSGSQHGVRAG